MELALCDHVFEPDRNKPAPTSTPLLHLKELQLQYVFASPTVSFFLLVAHPPLPRLSGRGREALPEIQANLVNPLEIARFPYTQSTSSDTTFLLARVYKTLPLSLSKATLFACRCSARSCSVVTQSSPPTSNPRPRCTMSFIHIIPV